MKVMYVIKLNGVTKFKSWISQLEDYPSIKRIEYNQNQFTNRVMIKIYSMKELKVDTNLISTITNYAIPDDCEATVRIIAAKDIIERFIMPKTEFYINSLGRVIGLNSNRYLV